jgi:hypothetical protein
VTPTLIDAEALYHNGEKIIYFTIKNSGLVAADNGRFSFGKFQNDKLVPLSNNFFLNLKGLNSSVGSCWSDPCQFDYCGSSASHQRY